MDRKRIAQCEPHYARVLDPGRRLASRNYRLSRPDGVVFCFASCKAPSGWRDRFWFNNLTNQIHPPGSKSVVCYGPLSSQKPIGPQHGVDVSGPGTSTGYPGAVFRLIARSLGAVNYGAFIGVVALVGIVYPFATLGSGNLLVKNVSRDASLFGLYWGRALATTAISGSILFSAVLLLSHFVLPARFRFAWWCS